MAALWPRRIIIAVIIIESFVILNKVTISKQQVAMTTLRDKLFDKKSRGLLLTVISQATLFLTLSQQSLLSAVFIRSIILEDTVQERQNKRKREEEELPFMKNICRFLGGPQLPIPHQD